MAGKQPTSAPGMVSRHREGKKREKGEEKEKCLLSTARASRVSLETAGHVWRNRS